VHEQLDVTEPGIPVGTEEWTEVVSLLIFISLCFDLSGDFPSDAVRLPEILLFEGDKTGR
jgi:hypothetical protein